MLNVVNISKSYDNIPAIKKISFHISSGEILGLLGSNGAGKTTTLSILSGLMKPDSGFVSLYEVEDPNEFKSQIGCVFDDLSPSMDDLRKKAQESLGNTILLANKREYFQKNRCTEEGYGDFQIKPQRSTLDILSTTSKTAKHEQHESLSSPLYSLGALVRLFAVNKQVPIFVKNLGHRNLL